MKIKKLTTRLSLISVALLQLAFTTPAQAELAWHSLSSGFSGVDANTIVTSPTHINEAFIGTLLGGLYKTVDDGATWHEVGNHIFSAKIVFQIEFNPNHADEMYAATDAGLFKSIDDGENWTVIDNAPFTGSRVRHVIINPTNANDILIVSDKGMFKSVDDGATWQHVTEGLAGVLPLSMLYDPNQPNVVLMSTLNGLKRSIDGGSTWHTFPTLLDGHTICELKVVGKKIVALGESLVYVSENGGYKWINVTPAKENPKDDNYIVGFAVDEKTNTLYLSVYPKGIYQSTDAGKSWTLIKSTTDYIGLLAINSQHPTEMYGYSADGILQTQDAGKNWALKNTGLMMADVYRVVSDPNTTDNLYALAGRGYYAMHDGVNWEKGSDQFKDIYLSDIVVDPVNSSNVLLSVYYDPTHTLTSPIYISHDSAHTWQPAIMAPVSSWKPTQITAMAISPTNPKQMLACAEMMYQSQDGGENWAPASYGHCESITLKYHPTNADEVFSSDYDDDNNVGNLLDSKDNGKTWTPLAQFKNSAVLSLAFDPTNSNIMYAGLAGKDNIFKSTDSGKTWINLSVPLFRYEAVNSIIVDPANPQIIYVGSGDYNQSFDMVLSKKGVYVSTDAGAHWAPMNNGLYNTVVYSLSLSNNKLFAGTMGSGVFTSNTLVNAAKK